MIIFPAVDIQGGKAVRLKRGKKEDCDIFADNPLDAARAWAEQGAQWLHIVDLDGAFEGRRANAALIGAITRELGLPAQAGGGIRSISDAAQYLENGVTRVIIGTAALEKPEIFREMCREFPDKIGVSLDGENGMLKSRGWLADTGLKAADILQRLEDDGAAFVIYTDIARDGMQCGVNTAATEAILRQTRLPVIAAGGVSSLDDLKALMAIAHCGNLEGVISGRALYDGSLDLPAAITLLADEKQA